MSTPNMLLLLPPVGIEPGPDWAQELNDNFSTIDSHDHTQNSGARIPTAGLNINADLPVGGFNLLNVRTTQYQDQVTTPAGSTDNRIVYSKNGELAYRDALGQEVIITNNGSITGASGNISGLVSPASASYSSITDAFTFNWNTAQPGRLNISDIHLYEFANPTANPVTIASAAAVPTPYTITVPVQLPANGTQSLTITTSGVLGYPNGVNGIGMVPIGAVVASMPYLTGAYTCAATTVADPETGYVLCQGQVLADSLSPMDGQTIPNISDDRYLRGSTTSGTVDGANTHAHNMAHSHQMWTVANTGISLTQSVLGRLTVDNSSENIPVSGSNTIAFNVQNYQPDAGAISAGFYISSGGPGTNYPVYTTGVASSVNGAGAAASTAFSSSEPQYITTVYLMRVY